LLGYKVIPEGKLGIILRKGSAYRLIEGPKRRFIIPFYDKMIFIKRIENITLNDIQIIEKESRDILMSMDFLYEVLDPSIYVGQAKDSKEALIDYFITEAHLFLKELEIETLDEMKWQLKEYFQSLTQALEMQYQISFKALELVLR
jgi:regulator of protease activity HflC (stomatin/prohibitin superfamily)